MPPRGLSKRLAGSFLLVSLCLAAAAPAAAEGALLIVAHGSKDARWNELVIHLVDQVQWPGPVGVAFLMDAPPDHTLDTVAAQLDQEGVSRIIVVPLLVSSFSGHYEEIRYYVGERADPPAHTHYDRLRTRARLVLTPAMDAHPLLSRILIDHAQALSRDPANESLILVAHGPNDEADNRRWLDQLQRHADEIQGQFGFRRVAVLTLRDDAPQPIRDAATEELRATVKAAAADSRVLVLPVLVSVGYIQGQIHERMEGLDYTMSEKGLAEHPLVAEWVRQRAAESSAALASRN